MANLGGVLLRRLGTGIIAIWLLMTGVFFLMRFVGDPAVAIAGPDATMEQLEAIRMRLNLHLPVWEQYMIMLGNVIQGDFGSSFRTGQPAWGMVMERMPATLQLTAVAFSLAVVIGIPIGVIASIKPGSIVDSITRVLAVLGQSTPIFWLGILAILFFAVRLGWFPAGGRGTLRHLVLPGFTLALYSVPLAMRLTRSSMLEVMGKDYIRTARSKGLPERVVVFQHALRSAMIPVVTVLALRLGAIITGAIVLEQVFAYPGIGRLAIVSLEFRDFPTIEAFIVLVAFLVIAVNFLADVIYSLIDPRIRIS